MKIILKNSRNELVSFKKDWFHSIRIRGRQKRSHFLPNPPNLGIWNMTTLVWKAGCTKDRGGGALLQMAVSSKHNITHAWQGKLLRTYYRGSSNKTMSRLFLFWTFHSSLFKRHTYTNLHNAHRIGTRHILFNNILFPL